MKFKAGQRRKAIEYEKDLGASSGKSTKTFEKSVEKRPKDNAGYVFYDGRRLSPACHITVYSCCSIASKRRRTALLDYEG